METDDQPSQIPANLLRPERFDAAGNYIPTSSQTSPPTVRAGGRDNIVSWEYTLRQNGFDYRSKREQAELARLKLLDTIRNAVAFTTMSEAEIARVAGVQRETVRKALGK